MEASKSPPLCRADAMTALLHWSLAAAVVVSLGSGLRIAGDAAGAALPAALAGMPMQGPVIAWHIWSSVALTFVAIAYVAYIVRADLTARIVVDAARLRALAAADRGARWQAVNVLGHWFAFLLVAGMALSGALLYLDRPLLPHTVLTGLHRLMAWSFIAYAAVHVALQLAIGGLRQLLKMMVPRLAYGAAARVALLTGGAVVAVVYALDDAAIRNLVIARHEATGLPVVDGYLDDAAWTRARAVTVHTVRGRNQPGGEVPVTVRALHDGQYAFFAFDWPDATRSQKHLPLLKGDDGWIVVGSDVDKDENDYHEDKFAVLLASSPQSGGGTSHLGPQPIPGAAGSPNGRGLHFTRNGSAVDLWQWKSVRTNPVGMVEDGYVGPPTLPTDATSDGGPAYPTGYSLDPRTGGGATANYRRLDDGIRVQPLHLPRTPFLTARLGRVDLAPDASDAGEWWMAMAETVPWSETLDAQYPVGTVLPSVVIDGPLEGDRGDVRGVGRWHDGRWRLEMVRRLHTGSEFDLPIASGTYLWVAAFDHAQTRHSQHLHPLRLELEE